MHSNEFWARVPSRNLDLLPEYGHQRATVSSLESQWVRFNDRVPFISRIENSEIAPGWLLLDPVVVLNAPRSFWKSGNQRLPVGFPVHVVYSNPQITLLKKGA